MACVWLSVALLAGVFAHASEDPLPEKGALVESGFVRGSLWGLGPQEAARRLGFGAAPRSPGLPPVWFLSRTFPRLWDAPETEEGFKTVELSSGSWLVFREDRLFGVVRRVPLDDWDAYELAARKRFGAPQKTHFAVDPASGPGDGTRHMHIYRWGGRRSQFYIIKATGADTRAKWQDASGQVSLRVRMRPENPATTPLFVAAFDAKAIAGMDKGGK